MIRLAQFAAAVTVAATVAFFAAGGMAVSQQTGSGPTLASAAISLNDLIAPWMPLIMAGIGGVIVALLEFIRQWVKARTGIMIEDARMRQMQAALENAAGLVLTKVEQKSKDVTLNVGSDAVRQGIEYVNQSAADAVKEFGLTRENIAEKIIAKVGVITAPNPEIVVKSDVPPPPSPGAGG